MQDRKKIFFASDFHLGLNAGGDSQERERRVVSWLRTIAPEAAAIYLLGDIFDFWWEYRKVVPKGFTRFLGCLSDISDSGVPIHFLSGNHDMWTGSYLTEECGVSVSHGVVEKTIDGRNFLLAHGEGLGVDGMSYRLLLGLFRNRAARALWSAIHPRIGMAIGQRWSLSSRLGKGIRTPFMGDERESLIRYAKAVAANRKTDFFIFGHRHLPLRRSIEGGGEIVMLGDWIRGSSYAVWDGEELRLVSSGQTS